MSDWWFWGVITTGVVGLLALLKIAAEIKALWPSRAKPKLLDDQNCFVRLSSIGGGGIVSFELLVSNIGSKDCSII